MNRSAASGLIRPSLCSRPRAAVIAMPPVFVLGLRARRRWPPPGRAGRLDGGIAAVSLDAIDEPERHHREIACPDIVIQARACEIHGRARGCRARTAAVAGARTPSDSLTMTPGCVRKTLAPRAPVPRDDRAESRRPATRGLSAQPDQPPDRPPRGPRVESRPRQAADLGLKVGRWQSRGPRLNVRLVSAGRDRDRSRSLLRARAPLVSSMCGPKVHSRHPGDERRRGTESEEASSSRARPRSRMAAGVRVVDTMRDHSEAPRKSSIVDDPFATAFEAQARASTFQGRPSLVLDRTLFYPRRAGSLADRGTLVVGLERRARRRSPSSMCRSTTRESFIHLRDEAGRRLVAIRGAWSRCAVKSSVRGGASTWPSTLRNICCRARSWTWRKAATVSARLGATSCTIDIDVPQVDEAPSRAPKTWSTAVIRMTLRCASSFPRMKSWRPSRCGAPPRCPKGIA